MANIEAIKRERGIPRSAYACHTAEVDGYLVEGHVPAEDIDRIIAERPGVAGIAVPGMPVGSPGMEVPGSPPARYDVLLFTADGETRVFDRR